ncbi:MAG: acyltransferase [Mobilitalea sp.]
MKNVRNRDYAISFIRAIALIMIIICHFMQYYNNELAWWFNTGVQIFLCISGFLYSEKEIKNGYVFIRKGFVKLLTDYYIYIFISIVVYAVFAPQLLSLIGIVKLAFCSGVIAGLGHLWFVGTILFCYLLTPLFYEIIHRLLKENKAISILKTTIMMLIMYVALELFVSHFNAVYVMCYFVGYIIGMEKNMLGEKWTKVIGIIIIPAAIAFNLFQIYADYIVQYNMGNGIKALVYERFCSVSHVLLGISLFIILYIFYNKLNIENTVVEKILDLTDEYSYDVYLAHHVWINIGALSILNLNIHIVFRLLIILCLIGLEVYVIRLLARKFSNALLKRNNT